MHKLHRVKQWRALKMATDKERLARLEAIEDERKELRKVICDAIRHVIYGAIGLVCGGFMSGWHLPESMRKAFSEWISK